MPDTMHHEEEEMRPREEEARRQWKPPERSDPSETYREKFFAFLAPAVFAVEGALGFAYEKLHRSARKYRRLRRERDRRRAVEDVERQRKRQRKATRRASEASEEASWEETDDMELYLYEISTYVERSSQIVAETRASLSRIRSLSEEISEACRAEG